MAIERASTLWRHRDFMALWSGVTVSEIGTQVSQLALPLAAVTVLGSGSLGVGVLRALETLPYLLIGLPAGVWVEHRLRRPVLMRADALRLIVVASIPVAYALGQLTLAQMYAVALVAGAASVLFDLAYRSYLPRLLTREQLLEGNAKLSLSESVAQVGGPGIAGLLITLLGPVPAVAVDAASFAASALGVRRIRAEEPPAPVRAPDDTTAGLVAAGLHYVRSHPLLRWLTVCTTLVNLSLAMVETVLIVFLARTLHLDAARIGVVFLIGGTGVIAGALAAPVATRRLGYGPLNLAALAVAVAGGVLAPLAPGDHGGMWLVAASQWVVSFGASIYNVTQMTLRQAVCPDSLQGRMNATVRFLTWGVIPIGNMAGGVLGQVLGLRQALWISVAFAALALPWLLPARLRRLRELPAREADPQPPRPGSGRSADAPSGAA